MNRLFDTIIKRYMPGTPDLSKLVREHVIQQNGIIAPIRKPGLVEDEMEVDIGDFNVLLEEYKSDLKDDFDIDGFDYPDEINFFK